MKKTPTYFERDWNGDRSRVVPIVNAACQWVADGEGAATRKVDGTCCMVRGGALYKRREIKRGDVTPANFELADYDDETGKTVGWVPVGDGPDDRWHREAFRSGLADGTYELVGPRIQGNPEGYTDHQLVSHADLDRDPIVINNPPPRDFDGLRVWLAANNVEGIVWHHPDGRMAKIKGRDFGIKRNKSATEPTP